MAKKRSLPGFRQKRKLLYARKPSPDKLRETGLEFMEARRFDDALEFFQAADATDLIGEVARAALEEGNTPLLMRARRAAGQQVRDAEWRQLAESAEQRGMLSWAYVARRQMGDEAAAARLRSQLLGDVQEQPEPDEAAAGAPQAAGEGPD